MKGILGKKIGMTSVFTDQGINIPVTVIEVKPNVVTNVLIKSKHGYNAIQLSAFDRRDKNVSKPVLGHLKKAKTNAKYFIKEIKNMTGFNIGEKIDASIFKSGEFVDVSGISKGKGFQGTIKRHNQMIGPKSHGGGGGSKPTRQTGSIGDVVSNRVFKGMTMPGQMGNVKKTVQNLQIINIDISNHIILVKGSIPGPKKGYVIVKESIKQIPAHNPIKLVDTFEANKKNELLEQAKKVGANVNTNMSILEMEKIIQEASETKKKEQEVKQNKKVDDLKKSEDKKGDK